MYICICNAVTDHSIRAAVREGVRTFAELRERTGCGDCCGSCEELASEILEESRRPRVLDLPMLSAAA